MVVLTLGGGELGLEFGQRAGLRPRPRFPPSGGGGEVLLPGIKPVGFEAQFLRDHRGRLATAMPVLERFALEGFIEFTTDFNRCLVHGTSFHCSPNSPSVNSKQPQALGNSNKESKKAGNGFFLNFSFPLSFFGAGTCCQRAGLVMCGSGWGAWRSGSAAPLHGEGRGFQRLSAHQSFPAFLLI